MQTNGVHCLGRGVQTHNLRLAGSLGRKSRNLEPLPIVKMDGDLAGARSFVQLYDPNSDLVEWVGTPVTQGWSSLWHSDSLIFLYAPFG
jgi:hypothetical protein